MFNIRSTIHIDIYTYFLNCLTLIISKKIELTDRFMKIANIFKHQ